MAEEPEKQPEKTEKAGKTPNQQFVEDFVSEFPYAKPILKYIRREGRAIYDGFIVFGIIALIIGWFAFSKGYDYGAKALETTKGELKDAKGDRDKYQLMLAPFQAMAIQVYTNVPLDKRLDYFTSQFLTFKTNLLTDIEAEKPFFDFFINNRLVTNGSVISVKESRQLEINIRNSSEISAENLNVDFICPLELNTNNIICGQNWMTQPQTILGKGGKIIPIPVANHWSFTDLGSLPGSFGVPLTPICISTNFTLPVISVQFVVSANRSKRQEYHITLTF